MKNFLQTSCCAHRILNQADGILDASSVMVEDGMQRFSNSDFPSETMSTGTLPRGELISPQRWLLRSNFTELAAGKVQVG